MELTFSEHFSSYHGRKERAAIVYLGGNEFKLGLADTARCVQSEQFAVDLMVNLAQRLGVDDMPDAGAQLTAHCRKISKWKERKPRY